MCGKNLAGKKVWMMNADATRLAFVASAGRSHPRGERHHLIPPPTRSVRFIIHHLDKLFLIPPPAARIRPPRPCLSWPGGGGSWRGGLFFFPDPCLISGFALFLCVLIKSRWSRDRFSEELLIREASHKHFFLHAGLEGIDDLAVGETDKRGKAH